MPTYRNSIAALLASLVVLVACSEKTSGPTGSVAHGGRGTTPGSATDADGSSPSASADAGTSRVSEYTYYQHVAPVLNARCVPCHKSDGVGPFALDSFENAKKWALSAASAVRTRTMPPFPPDDSNCREIEDARKMPDSERDLLIDWAEGQTPAGDKNAPARLMPNVPSDTLGMPTRTFVAQQSYDPPEHEDEYRCFLVDPKLSEPWTFLRSLGITTNNWKRVHHAIVYVVPPAVVLSAQLVDAAEAGPGWSCYFGTKVDGSIPAGGFAPGAVQAPYPGQTTVPIQTGTQFIVEMHFHSDYNSDPVSFSVATWEFDKPVDRFPEGLSMFNSNFTIPAGAPSVKANMQGRFIAADQTVNNPSDPNAVHEAKEGLLWSVDFHMHLRGKTARVDLVRADGSRECLLDIPDWNDNWQGGYKFKEPIRARAGDRLEATCEWDNSEANQPVIHGKKLEPTELRWGVEALQEMCNASVAITRD